MHRLGWMRMFLVVSAVASVGVGCGGGGGVGDQFCHDWAAASCHKIWQCPDPFGPSEAACTQGFTSLCADPQPAGQTSDVSCVGATHVNEAAKTLCLNQIAAQTCDDLNSGNVVTVCDQVCVKGAAGVGGSNGGGVGGSNGGGVGGSNGGGTGGIILVPNATPTAFCNNTFTIACNRVFDCVPPAQRDANFTDMYGNSVTECLGNILPLCQIVSCTAFSTAGANTCINDWQAASCSAILNNNSPASCTVLGC